MSPSKASPWGVPSSPCLLQPCAACRITRTQKSGKADWLALPEMSSSAVLIHCSDRSLINTLQQVTVSDLQYLVRLLLQPWREGQEGTTTLVLQMNLALNSLGNMSKITRDCVAWGRTTPRSQALWFRSDFALNFLLCLAFLRYPWLLNHLRK